MATASLLLDRSRTLKGTNQHPVCIRITHLRKQWSIGMKVYASEKDYKKAMTAGEALNDRQKELRDILNSNRLKAQNVLDSMNVVTLHTFKQHFFSEIDLHTAKTNSDMKTQFESYINELKGDDQVGNASFYENALKAFLKFRGNADLTCIDEDYLKKFVVYWNKKGNSKATAQVYLSKLRRIFNRAIRNKVITRKYYPFGIDGYSVGTSARSKKALMPDQVKALWDYVPRNDTQAEAKDYWFLSYLCHGANNMDMMRLRWKDVSMTQGTLTFERQTTKNTNEGRTVVVYLHDEARRILERRGIKGKPNDYVFPLLRAGMTEAEIFRTVKDWRRHVNRCLNRIGTRLGFDLPLSISVARHSFSTALKLKGTPVAVISDCMGHASIKTTEIYLSTIPDDFKREISSGLLDFNRNTVLKAV